MNKTKGVLLHKKSKVDIPSNYIRLENEWFDHRNSITEVSGISPGSLSEIKTFGIFEKIYPLRDYLKKIDTLLSSAGGILSIIYFTAGDTYTGGSFIRPISFLLREISLSYGNRYQLVKKEEKNSITELIFIKNKGTEILGDSITKWSFGIVSDGRKKNNINNIISQIHAFNIPNYEIIICGPENESSYPTANIKVLTDLDLYHDLRTPITAKKNRIIHSSKFNNLVILHDRISFPDDWYEKMVTYGNCFEILTNKILDEETHSLRVQDWMVSEIDFNNYETKHIGYFPYDKWHPNIYVDGGFIIVKKNIIMAINGYNNSLHWGEAEDVDLSVRLYNAGYVTNINTKNEVYTKTHRHKGIDNQTFFKKPNLLKEKYNNLKNKNYYQKNLKKEKQSYSSFISMTKIDFTDFS